MLFTEESLILRITTARYVIIVIKKWRAFSSTKKLLEKKYVYIAALLYIIKTTLGRKSHTPMKHLTATIRAFLIYIKHAIQLHLALRTRYYR